MRWAIVAALGLSMAACSEDKWDGFAYPKADNLADFVHVGTYDSLEQCRDAARSLLREIAPNGRSDYECGLNCGEPDEFGLRVCEKTLD